MELEPVFTLGNGVVSGLVLILIGMGFSAARKADKVAGDLAHLKETDHVKRLEFEELRKKVDRVAERQAAVIAVLQRNGLDGKLGEGE